MMASPLPPKKILKLPSISPVYKRSTRCISTKINSDFPRSLQISSNSSLQRSHRNTLHISGLEKKYLTYLKEKSIASHKVNEIHQKIDSIRRIQTKYGIKLTHKEIQHSSLKYIEEKAREIHQKRVKVNAYCKIAAWWKRKLIMKKIAQQAEQINRAVEKIQRFWRRIKFKKSAEKVIKNEVLLRESAAVYIQKHARGFLTRRNYTIIIKQRKMQKCFNFFDEIKQRLYKDSIEKISCLWLAYRTRKQFLAYKSAVKEEKQTILKLLSSRNSKENISEVIKTILVRRSSVEKSLKTQSEPESPHIKYSRLRSGTEDFFTKEKSLLKLRQ